MDYERRDDGWNTIEMLMVIVVTIIILGFLLGLWFYNNVE